MIITLFVDLLSNALFVLCRLYILSRNSLRSLLPLGPVEYRQWVGFGVKYPFV